MRILTLLATVIILSFLVSCSTSNLSVGTVNVKHKKETENNISPPALAVASADSSIEIISGKPDPLFYPGNKASIQTDNVFIKKYTHSKVCKKNSLSTTHSHKLPKEPATAPKHPHDKNASNHVIAMVSYVCGILSIVFSITVIGALPFALVAIVFGIISSSHGEDRGSKGSYLGIAGIIAAVLFALLYIVIILVLIAAIAG